MLNQLEEPKSFIPSPSFLVQGVLEGLTDGILILSQDGEWIYHNYYAHRICQQLSQQPNPGRFSEQQVPDGIWRNCRALIESQEFYTDQPIVIESEIALSRTNVYRIRVRWLTLDDCQSPYLLVLLEDRCQVLQNRAIAETVLYDLTARQAEVWLLYRAGFSYQQIADELYIALNTVKRHLKDIRLKQKMIVDLEEQAEYVSV
jgi:DNA-binding CsgD family transcriptional regulator